MNADLSVGANVLGSLFALGIFLFWVWALVDCLKRDQGESRIVWVLVIVLLGVLGALLYLMFRRSAIQVDARRQYRAVDRADLIDAIQRQKSPD